MVSQYTDTLEEEHAYIKETVDTAFPSDIRLLQVRLPALGLGLAASHNARNRARVSC